MNKGIIHKMEFKVNMDRFKKSTVVTITLVDLQKEIKNLKHRDLEL